MQKLKQKVALGSLVIGLLVGLLTLDSAYLKAELATDSHIGPTAILAVSDTLINTNREVMVDASASHDSRNSQQGLLYRFDFQSRYDWTDWSGHPTAGFRFTKSGYYPIRLQVKDSDGRIDETSVGVRVQFFTEGEMRPSASFDVMPKKGNIDTLFEFTVSPYSNIGTPVQLLEVRWDWERDGVWDTDWSVARSFRHQFKKSGIKEVWLEVRDKNNLTSVERGYYVVGQEDEAVRTKKIGRIKVEKSTRPRAAFRASPQNGVDGVVVRFDARQSLRATRYRWDFDGDGTFDTAWMTHPMVKQRYKQTGDYTVYLEVRSSTGEVDRTEQQVSVATAPPEIAPEAYFTVRNTTNSAGDEMGALLDIFSFNASSSRDPDGSNANLEVRWDFEGDGQWDTTYSVSKSAEHRYTKVGEYRPVVEVVDEFGNQAIYERRIRILQNTAPKASLKVRPLVGIRNTEFYFDAGGSTDGQNNKSKLEVRFDFDSDRVFDTPWGTLKTARHRYSKSGYYTITVEVRDTGMAVTRATQRVEVVDPTPPVAIFYVTPESGTFDTNFKFDASATYEPSGVGGPLEYRWDFSSQGQSDFVFDTPWQTSPRATHRYAASGEHLVHLAVRNSENEISDFFQKISIHPDSSYLKYLKDKGLIRSEDPDRLITRAELAEVVVRAARLHPVATGGRHFTDVKPQDPAAPYIAAVTTQDWMSPRSDFSFKPTAPVTRAEAVKVIISALYPRVSIYVGKPDFVDIPQWSWYSRFAHIAYLERFVPATKNAHFYPAQKITQAEMARMIARLLQKYDLPNLRVAAEGLGLSEQLLSSVLNSLFYNK